MMSLLSLRYDISVDLVHNSLSHEVVIRVLPECEKGDDDTIMQGTNTSYFYERSDRVIHNGVIIFSSPFYGIPITHFSHHVVIPLYYMKRKDVAVETHRFPKRPRCVCLSPQVFFV